MPRAKARKPEPKNHLRGWFDVIHKLGNDRREREVERKKAVASFDAYLAERPDLEQVKLLTVALDEGVLNLNEYFSRVRAVLGLPEPE